MGENLTYNIEKHGISRRKFLLTAGAAIATWPALQGCAVNPVTGKSQIMLVSQDQEIAMDKQASPHQFSADHGAVQDVQLNNYISGVSTKMARLTHRPEMPYNFRAVNANYANAYAFPGGSIAVTRGLLVELEDESELGALMGHELGHVNARHTASRMTQGLFVSALVAGASIYAGSKLGGEWAPLINLAGGITAGALLSYYSRENEREADELGQEYSARAGLNPQGEVGLMEVLMGLGKHEPSFIERLFASHPMSDDRYRDAVHRANTKYAYASKLPRNRDRFMDNTVRVRRQKPAIKKFFEGQKLMSKKQPQPAVSSLSNGLRMLPNDYSGLLLMSEAQLMLGRNNQAEGYARRASQVYPQEAGAQRLLGQSRLMSKKYQSAYSAFNAYDRMLPGNPQVTFIKGLCLEGSGDKRSAANHYYSFLKQVNQGEQAQYAYSRLQSWGVVK